VHDTVSLACPAPASRATLADATGAPRQQEWHDVARVLAEALAPLGGALLLIVALAIYIAVIPGVFHTAGPTGSPGFLAALIRYSRDV
jgi:hypothetical protein